MSQKKVNLYREAQKTFFPKQNGTYGEGACEDYLPRINDKTRAQRVTATCLKSQRNIKNVDFLVMCLMLLNIGYLINFDALS